MHLMQMKQKLWERILFANICVGAIVLRSQVKIDQSLRTS